MTETEALNWQALYIATGAACLLAACLTTLALACQVMRERPWRRSCRWRNAVLLLPRLWWRWQKLYWLATPVILSIVIGFAASLDWS